MQFFKTYVCSHNLLIFCLSQSTTKTETSGRSFLVAVWPNSWEILDNKGKRGDKYRWEVSCIATPGTNLAIKKRRGCDRVLEGWPLGFTGQAWQCQNKNTITFCNMLLKYFSVINQINWSLK